MSRRGKSTKRRPMLYIDQPDLQAPTPNMQENYHSPKPEKLSTTTVSQPTKRPKSRKSSKSNELKQTDKLDIHENESPENHNLENDSIEEPIEQEEILEKADEEKDEEEEENEAKTVNQSQEKVPFAEMSLIEQVDYLAASPGFMPKIKCEVITEDERFKGIIRERKEETVYIETFKRPRYHQILLHEIASIRLLGF
ncbi:CotO family spore coat protein [Paraliobacillus salinarum]|uniref:CotO family spore coat protein n=1 Tax=Paraliobacillus salinarum TaxID=1158996 RepID=UPI0015F3FF20|nr:CotO family spore coat protein [Paraliobacillus salinarum]